MHTEQFAVHSPSRQQAQVHQETKNIQQYSSPCSERVKLIFVSHFDTQVRNSCQFPRNMSKSQTTMYFCIFSRGSFKQKQSQILQLLFDWTALKWRPQRNIQTAKHCLVWVSFVFAQNGKHWSCSTCLAMLHTAQVREGSYSFVVKH